MKYFGIFYQRQLNGELIIFSTNDAGVIGCPYGKKGS